MLLVPLVVLVPGRLGALATMVSVLLAGMGLDTLPLRLAGRSLSALGASQWGALDKNAVAWLLDSAAVLTMAAAWPAWRTARGPGLDGIGPCPAAAGRCRRRGRAHRIAAANQLELGEKNGTDSSIRGG